MFGMDARHDRMGGRCRTNGAPGTRVGSAAAATPRRSRAAASHCNFKSHCNFNREQGFPPNIAPNGAPLPAHGRLTDCAMMKECR
jgi:hypothetical protein